MESSGNNPNRNTDKDENLNGIQLNNTKCVESPESGERQHTGTCECEKHVCEVLKSFCSHTSLHGIQYVGEKGHIALRLLWTLVVLLAFGAAIYHICHVYSKWKETPATVTISPNVKDIKEVFFPAVTICAPALLTESFANEFLDKKHHRYDQRKKVVDLYCKYGGFPSHEISEEDYYIWRRNTQLSCDELMAYGKYPDANGAYKRIVPDHVIPTQALVDDAIIKCCTFNSQRDDLMYKNINITSGKDTKKPKDLLTPTGIGTQNALSFFIEGLRCLEENLKFRISIHHPAEAPNVEGDGLILKPGSETSYTVKPLQTESTENLKYLKPEDRKCQNYDDVHLRFFKNYTQWNCNLDCLANLTIERCTCLPPYLPENNGTLKICKSSSDFACFHNLQRDFQLDRRDRCKCEQACTDVMYLVTTQYVPAEKEDKNILSFNVYFTEPTYFTYQRSQILGLSGFLASCGGLLGLFMGFSFISMIEIFYFGIFGMWKSVFGSLVKRGNQ